MMACMLGSGSPSQRGWSRGTECSSALSIRVTMSLMMAVRTMPDTALDISSNNPIDWAKAQLDPSVRMVWAKCTEGRSWADPSYIKNKAGITKLPGIRFGAYHYARPDINEPKEEVENFLKHVGPLRVGDRVALDFEKGAKRTPEQMVEWAGRWLDGVLHGLQ